MTLVPGLWHEAQTNYKTFVVHSLVESRTQLMSCVLLHTNYIIFGSNEAITLSFLSHYLKAG